TVLVASPKATGNMPEASGSSVPACPAFLALNRRLSLDTAWIEVRPTGLSSTIQPLTSTRVERGALTSDCPDPTRLVDPPNPEPPTPGPPIPAPPRKDPE